MTSLDHIVTISAGEILNALSRAAKVTFLRTQLSLPGEASIPINVGAAGLREFIRSLESVNLLNPMSTMTEANGAWSVDSHGQRIVDMRRLVFDHVSPLATDAQAAVSLQFTEDGGLGADMVFLEDSVSEHQNQRP